jgi:hypothetical protein
LRSAYGHRETPEEVVQLPVIILGFVDDCSCSSYLCVQNGELLRTVVPMVMERLLKTEEVVHLPVLILSFVDDC